MSAQNLSETSWVRAQGTLLTGRMQVTTAQAVLHTIILNSYGGGSFRVGNGTLTSTLWLGGTYTPAAGTLTGPQLDYKELEFANGIFIDATGAINATVIYNDIV